MSERYITTDTELTSVADAIRSKGGTSDKLAYPDGFVSAIGAIETGGGGGSDVEDAIITRTITEISNNRVTTIGNYAFGICNALTTVSFPAVTTIGTYAFRDCFLLTSLMLQSTRVCTLSSINAFSGCYHILGTKSTTYNPTGAKDGYIYVPDDLVDSYKSATNWSTYASQIKPISEYTGDLT